MTFNQVVFEVALSCVIGLAILWVYVYVWPYFAQWWKEHVVTPWREWYCRHCQRYLDRYGDEYGRWAGAHRWLRETREERNTKIHSSFL